MIDSHKFFVVCDLETTGTDVMKCDWITGSFSRVRIADFFIESELELESRPVNHWDDEARYIHRIPKYKADNFPERSKTLQVLIDWLPPKEDFIFVCHASQNPFNFAIKQRVNVTFDFAMLKWDFFNQDRYFDFYKHFDDQRLISTKTISNDFFHLEKELDLKQVCASLGIKMFGDHHDSQVDRKACEEILRRYLIESGRNIERKRDSKLDSRVFESEENRRMEEQQRLDL